MDRRVTALVGLLASGLICVAAQSFAAATHCNPDYTYTWNTVQSAASTVHAAPVQPKTETPPSAPSNSTSTAAASGGGDDAGNMSEGGGGNMHKRGLRWQSFLPGVIK